MFRGKAKRREAEASLCGPFSSPNSSIDYELASPAHVTGLPLSDDAQISRCRHYWRSRQRRDRARQAVDAGSGCRRAAAGRTGQDRRIAVVDLKIVAGVSVVGIDARLIQ